MSRQGYIMGLIGGVSLAGMLFIIFSFKPDGARVSIVALFLASLFLTCFGFGAFLISVFERNFPKVMRRSFFLALAVLIGIGLVKYLGVSFYGALGFIAFVVVCEVIYSNVYSKKRDFEDFS